MDAKIKTFISTYTVWTAAAIAKDTGVDTIDKSAVAALLEAISPPNLTLQYGLRWLKYISQR